MKGTEAGPERKKLSHSPGPPAAIGVTTGIVPYQETSSSGETTPPGRQDWPILVASIHHLAEHYQSGWGWNGVLDRNITILSQFLPGTGLILWPYIPRNRMQAGIFFPVRVS